MAATGASTTRTGRVIRRWSSALYAGVLALLALPFATLYSACSHDRIDTINGYQTLAPHTYAYKGADGSSHVASVGTDGFGWVAVSLVAIGIVLSLIGVRSIWLAITSVIGVVALFLMVTAAGGSAASTKAEIGFWLSTISIALAPAADERPWRRALIVAGATAVAAAGVIGLLILLIYLTAQRGHG
jgi:hypothetical protein